MFNVFIIIFWTTPQLSGQIFWNDMWIDMWNKKLKGLIDASIDEALPITTRIYLRSALIAILVAISIQIHICHWMFNRYVRSIEILLEKPTRSRSKKSFIFFILDITEVITWNELILMWLSNLEIRISTKCVFLIIVKAISSSGVEQSRHLRPITTQNEKSTNSCFIQIPFIQRWCS